MAAWNTPPRVYAPSTRATGGTAGSKCAQNCRRGMVSGPPHTYSGGTFTRSSGDFSDDFHTLAIEWEHGEIRWYVDDVHYHTETDWFSQGHGFPAPFEQRFHFLLNVAVGGNWPGSPDHTTEFPQQMAIDYVRVYQDTEAQHGVSLPAIFEDRFFNWEDAFTGFEVGPYLSLKTPIPMKSMTATGSARWSRTAGHFGAVRSCMSTVYSSLMK